MSNSHPFDALDHAALNALNEEAQENKAALRRTAEELRKERMFLDVLCKDYTSVYYLDLQNNTLEVLKLAASTNAAQMFSPQRFNTLPYAATMEAYCAQYVLEDEQDTFLHAMSKAHILETLARSDRFVYRYQTRPNPDGHCYFEAQVVRIAEDDFDDTALLAFRHIDDILTAEQRHQRALEHALQKEKASNELLAAISKIYQTMYSIDLEQDTYAEISSEDDVYHLTETHAGASQEMARTCNAVVRPEYRERMLRFLDLTTLADRLGSDETLAEEYLAQDGNWLTARYIVNRRDEAGRATHVLYVTRVISDAKRRERNFIAIAQEANKANDAKTDFLRRMSHDIRTPINGVLGMIEIADRHSHDVEKLQECRTKVKGAMEYLLSLVNNVLDLSKLESDDLVLEHEPFNLIPLLMKQLPIVAMQASENGLVFTGGKEMSRIQHRFLIGSPVHLNRILMNLANNAVKYNRPGGTLTVYCTETHSDENTAYYDFICSDTGIGMSEEFQKRAFEAFAQEGKPSLSSYSGSGLGLSIVQRIVDQMHGTIRLESKEGVGTTFIVSIPFEIDHAAQERADAPEAIAQKSVSVAGRRALLVEDNELNREIAQTILEDEGLLVDYAENGLVATQRFAASQPHTYDFIFMDIMMPVMDGLEATRHIRAMDRPDAQTVPILAMTANAFQDDIQRSLAAGMNAHLMKPLDFKKLKQVIRDFAQE